MAIRSGRVAVLVNEIDGIELDCAFEERVETRLKHTKSPREVDTEMTDHAILEAVEIVIHAGISNYNINVQAFEPSRITDAYDALLNIQREFKLITINTGLSIHDNMMLKRFGRVRTNRTGQVLDFIAIFEEVIFVAQESVLLAQVVPSPIASVTGSPGPERLIIESQANASSAGRGNGNGGQIDLSAPENQSIASRILNGA